jgi:tetratricopeptide (TPR) repeat protein
MRSMTVQDTDAETRPVLLLVAPFTPATEAHVTRAEPVGVSTALGGLLARYGYSVWSLYVPTPARGDAAEVLMSHNPLAELEERWIAVCGSYDPVHVLPLRLTLLNVSERTVVDVRSFGEGADRDALVEPIVRDIGHWLRAFGRGGDLPVPMEPGPHTVDEWLLDCRAAGAEWLAGNVSLLAGELDEFMGCLDEVCGQFLPRLGEPFVALRLRALIDAVLESMQAKLDELELTPRDLTQSFLELIFRVLAEGIARGADRAAFIACRASIHLWCGDNEAARSDFEALRAHAPRDALLGLGQVYEREGNWDAAHEAYDQAIAMCRPDELYRGLPTASDAAPLPDAPTWLGLLGTSLGRVETAQRLYEQAEATLRRALAQGATRVAALRALAQLYRGWGIALIEAGQEAGGQERLARHLELLDEIFELEPHMEEVDAAIDVARLRHDAALEAVWEGRGQSLAIEELVQQLRE